MNLVQPIKDYLIKLFHKKQTLYAVHYVQNTVQNPTMVITPRHTPTPPPIPPPPTTHTRPTIRRPRR